MDLKKRKNFIINIGYWAIILAIVFLVFRYLLSLIMPFLLAFIFSLILRPVVRFLTEKWKFRQNLAAILCVVLFYAILGTIIVVISARLVGSIGDLISTIPDIYTESIEPALTNAMENIGSLANRFDPTVVDLVQSVFPQIISALGNAVSSFSVGAVSFVSGIATKLPSFLIGAVICIIATVFMSIDYGRIAVFLLRQMPSKATALALDIKKSLSWILFRYGKSYLLIMLITFGEICVGLLIIGVKNAPLIAVVIAVFDIFPVIGSGLFLVPWTVVVLIQGNIVRGISLALLYAVVTIVRQIIEPKIVGKHVGLHPLLTLMSMFIGASLFGGIGLLGFPITIAIIKHLDDSGAINIFKKSPPEEKSDKATKKIENAEEKKSSRKSKKTVYSDGGKKNE